MKIASLTLAVLAVVGTGAAQAQSQGVSKTEVVIGSIQDLSGPVAAFGKQSRNGMQLRVDEINEQGGIHGRKLKLLVEDAGYDPKRAVLAAQKLVNQDKIFLMAGHIGTAHNNPCCCASCLNSRKVGPSLRQVSITTPGVLCFCQSR